MNLPRTSSRIDTKRRSCSALTLAALCLAGCGATQNAAGTEGPLQPGTSCPTLAADDHRGERVALPPEAPTLVFFYPKDGTPGCTREACAFRDAWTSYQEAGIRLVGVSADSNADHRAFADEHGLPFGLVADEDHVWADAFGVGRTLGMDHRVSFLIAAGGAIAATYESVDPGVHAEEVLADAARLGLTSSAAP